MMYAALYVGRAQIAAVLPAFAAEFASTPAQIGIVPAAFFWCYAVGLVANSFVTSRFAARNVLVFCALGSVVCNVLFAFSHSVLWAAVFWALNGCVQSIAWPIVTQTVGRHVAADLRGRAMAIISTSHIVGGAVALALVGALAQAFGWRAAFLVHASLMGAVAVVAGWRGWPAEPAIPETRRPLRETLWAVFGNREVALCAAALLFVNVTRHGLLVWLPAILSETAGLGVARAALAASLLPVAGCAGSLLCGSICDRLGRGREKIVIACLAIVACSVAALPAATSGIASVALLASAGATLFGAHMLIVGVLPIDHGRQRIANSTAFIDASGYFGVALLTGSTGWIQARAGWAGLGALWAAMSVLGALALLPLAAARRRPAPSFASHAREVAWR